MKTIVLPYELLPNWHQLCARLQTQHPDLLNVYPKSESAYLDPYNSNLEDASNKLCIANKEMFPALYDSMEKFCKELGITNPPLITIDLSEKGIKNRSSARYSRYIIPTVNKEVNELTYATPPELILPYGMLARYNSLPIEDADGNCIPQHFIAPEIESDIAHELSHHKHWWMTVTSTLGALWGGLAGLIYVNGKFSRDLFPNNRSISLVITPVLGGVGITALYNFVRRCFEDKADLESGVVTSKPEVTACMIESEAYYKGRRQERKGSLIRVLEALFLPLVNTHPSEQSRLEKMTNLAGKDRIEQYKKENAERLQEVDWNIRKEEAARQAQYILEHELKPTTVVKPNVGQINKLLQETKTLSAYGREVVENFRDVLLERVNMHKGQLALC